MERASWFTTATCPYVRSIWKLASMPGSLVIRSDSCGAEPGGGDPGYATQSPRWSAPKETEPNPPQKKPNHQNTHGRKTKAGGWGRSPPQPPRPRFDRQSVKDVP